MNIHHYYVLRNLILTVVLTMGFASSALAQRLLLFVDLNSKEVTDLGTLGGVNSVGLRHKRRRAGGGVLPDCQRAASCLHYRP